MADLDQTQEIPIVTPEDAADSESLKTIDHTILNGFMRFQRYRFINDAGTDILSAEVSTNIGIPKDQKSLLRVNAINRVRIEKLLRKLEGTPTVLEHPIKAMQNEQEILLERLNELVKVPFCNFDLSIHMLKDQSPLQTLTLFVHFCRFGRGAPADEYGMAHIQYRSDTYNDELLSKIEFPNYHEYLRGNKYVKNYLLNLAKLARKQRYNEIGVSNRPAVNSSSIEYYAQILNPHNLLPARNSALISDCLLTHKPNNVNYFANSELVKSILVEIRNSNKQLYDLLTQTNVPLRKTDYHNLHSTLNSIDVDKTKMFGRIIFELPRITLLRS